MLTKKQEYLEKKIEQEIMTAKKHGTKNKRGMLLNLSEKPVHLFFTCSSQPETRPTRGQAGFYTLKDFICEIGVVKEVDPLSHVILLAHSDGVVFSL